MGEKEDMAVLKIKRFRGNDRAKLENAIVAWLAKQPNNSVVQRKVVAPANRKSRGEPPVVVVTVWSESQAEKELADLR